MDSNIFVGGYCAVYYTDFVWEKILPKFDLTKWIILGMFAVLGILSFIYDSERLMILYQYFSGMFMILVWGECEGYNFRAAKYSFFIYCTHSIILKLMKPVYIFVFGSTYLSAVIWVIFGPLLIVCICVLMGAVLGKHFNPIYKVVTGNR